MRSNGVLVDIHPEPEPWVVEIRVGDQRTQVGEIGDRPVLKRIPPARATLAAAVEAGYFVRERETTFEFLSHFDSVESWLSYLAGLTYQLVPDEALVTDACQLLSLGTGQLVVRERVHAARLRRGTS